MLSPKIPAAYVQIAEQRGQVVQASGDQVTHAAFGFQRSFDH